MERPTITNAIISPKWAVAIIIIFHLVGLVGFLVSGLNASFKSLVPYHLLLMFLILILSYNADYKRLYLFIAGVFLCGYMVEVLGVKTLGIFGNYAYGNTMGLKVADVPLLMGINWVLLIFSVGQMVKDFKIRSSSLAALVGAALLVLFDFFMEPVAMKFDYWQWHDKIIPIQNYVAWFIVSVILLKFYYALHLKQQKYIGITLFCSQLVFFVVLYMTI
ncbi:putative membrane protein [Pedobacter sp. UYP30]|uniref:carotenoid biosynthesis protein n=1 Tax=Pedobacter sp. UYP30 TaxID=1756400 RepID=UPI0033955431